MRAKFRGSVEISLAECRAPTTPSLAYEGDLQSKRFQHLYRCLPDMRFVVANECVVPQNDAAAVVAVVVDRGARVTAPGYSMFLKPAIETFVRVFWQRPFRRKANGSFHQNADRWEFENGLCQSRHPTTNSPQNIRPAENTFAQAHPMFLMGGVEQFRFQQRQVHI